MAEVCFQFGSGEKARKLVYSKPQITLGRSPDCTVHVPLSWLEERHLIFQVAGDIVRVKAATPNVQATLGERPITPEWLLVPPKAELVLLGPGTSRLAIEVSFDASKVETPVVRNVPLALPPQVASQAAGSPAARPQLSTATPSVSGPKPQASPSPTVIVPKRSRLPLDLTILALAGVLLLVMIGILRLHAGGRSKLEDRHQENVEFIHTQLEKAKYLIDAKDYVKAKAALDEAAPLIRKDPLAVDEDKILEDMLRRPEIQFGSQGYIEVDSHWLTPELAQAWQDAKRKDDPRLAELADDATVALHNGQLERASRDCKQATEIIDAYPVKPAPHTDEIKRLTAMVDEQISIVKAASASTTEPASTTQGALASSRSLFSTTAPVTQVAVGSPSATSGTSAATPAAAQSTDDLESRKSKAYLQSQIFVRQLLKVPASALRFEPYGSSNVLVIDSNEWFRVIAPVEVRDSVTGKAMMQRYLCKLRLISKTGGWESDSTDMVDQSVN